MATEAQLQQDLQTAMKARARGKMYVLRGLLTAVKNLKVERRVTSLAEADIAALVRKEINKRTDAAQYARTANRLRLAEQNEAERAILETYLPHQLTTEELEAAIGQLASELGSRQIGPLMAALRERYAGQFDGKTASELIRKLA